VVAVSFQLQIQVIASQMVVGLFHLMAKDQDTDLDQLQIQVMEYLTVLVGNLPDKTLNLLH
jgi:hypothetical protein